MAIGTLSPVGKQQFFDDNGDPLASGKLYTYAAGTTTPAVTYSSSTISTGTQNANPIILNARGECVIYLAATSYKYKLATSADVEIWTQDNIASIQSGLPSGVGELFEFGGSADSPTNDAAYPSGTTMDKCHAGTAWLSLDTSTLAPGGIYELEAMLLSTSGTVTVGIMNLTDGSPDTALGTCASTSATGERVRSGSLTLAAGGAAKVYAIKIKTSGALGYAWGVKIIRTS